MEVVLNQDNFSDEVLVASGLFLIDFWASWCAPCLTMLPVIEELAAELEGKIKIGKVNIDENPELASTQGVLSIPTFILFKDGNEMGRLSGVQSKEKMLDLLGFGVKDLRH